MVNYNNLQNYYTYTSALKFFTNLDIRKYISYKNVQQSPRRQLQHVGNLTRAEKIQKIAEIKNTIADNIAEAGRIIDFVEFYTQNVDFTNISWEELNNFWENLLEEILPKMEYFDTQEQERVLQSIQQYLQKVAENHAMFEKIQKNPAPYLQEKYDIKEEFQDKIRVEMHNGFLVFFMSQADFLMQV